ncbi:SH3 domain-containing protein [Aquimarina intermedia]|uniref:SH3 domain-containing protein n=1 Tax=Aquimarina intermedia TaxID=350814 RepID=A0A5S5C787_9FLAO|nr:SH3 domain-containing protein [Aquimarina intermedia]TYP74190.1 SH3 domain-containing protein [Aquimarina intermedia]
MKTLIIAYIVLFNSVTLAQEIFFVKAKNGLIIRELPDIKSKRIGKFRDGHKVEVIERTDKSLTIWDSQEEITGRWYKVRSFNQYPSPIVGYVFNQYLLSVKTESNNAKLIDTKDYKIIISETTEEEFNNVPIAKDSSHYYMDEVDCKKAGYLSTVSSKEFKLRLVDDRQFTLNIERIDKDWENQFFGYTFVHYDTVRNLYVFWENWLEAGNPIIVNGLNGEIIDVMGRKFSSSTNENIFASYAIDIWAGWTPNGIQVFEVQNGSLIELYKIDPSYLLDENWGPVELKWIDESTILIECKVIDSKESFYKKLEFRKK